MKEVKIALSCVTDAIYQVSLNSKLSLLPLRDIDLNGMRSYVPADFDRA